MEPSSQPETPTLPSNTACEPKPSTQAHGSASEAGPNDLKAILERLAKLRAENPPSPARELDLPRSTAPVPKPSSEPLLKLSGSTGRAWLAEAIPQCCALQRAYGKTPAEMETLVEGFAMVLGDQPVEAVKEAFWTFIRQEVTIPTPSEILQLIERKGKRPFSADVYRQLSIKPGQSRTSDDWEYIREYERYMMG